MPFFIPQTLHRAYVIGGYIFFSASVEMSPSLNYGPQTLLEVSIIALQNVAPGVGIIPKNSMKL